MEGAGEADKDGGVGKEQKGEDGERSGAGAPLNSGWQRLGSGEGAWAKRQRVARGASAGRQRVVRLAALKAGLGAADAALSMATAACSYQRYAA